MRGLVSAATLFLMLTASPSSAQPRDDKVDIARSGPPVAPMLHNQETQRLDFNAGKAGTRLEVVLGRGSSTFNRPMSCSSLSTTGSSAPFESVTVRNTGVNIATLNVRLGRAGAPHSACTGHTDTVLAAYKDFFVPASPLTNCIAFNDDTNGARDRCSALTGIELWPNHTMVFVLSTFHSVGSLSEGPPESFSLSFAGSVPVALQTFSIE